MLRGYSFRPRAWSLALGAAACAAFVALGGWQARRAEEKRAAALQLENALRSAPIELSARASVHPAEFVSKRVVARGRFVPERTVFLDNKLRRGRPGYEVVTPLRLGDSDWHVLVDRGWIAAPARRDVLPQVRTPEGELQVVGLALERLPRALQAGPSAGRVRQNLELPAYAAETGLRLQPVVIEQRSEADDGLARDWPRVDPGVEKHEGYALQWYSLAALALVLAVALSFRRVA